MSTKTVREQSSESDSIILVVSACVIPSELSFNSLADVGLSMASNVSGGLLSMFGKLNCRSTSLNSLSALLMAKRMTDVVASDALDEVEFSV